MTDTQTTETQATGRVFYRTDYARFARALRQARHVRGQQYTEKGAGAQERIDTLTDTLAAVFAEDAAGAEIQGTWNPVTSTFTPNPSQPTAFDAEAFKAGTLLPAAPVYDVEGTTEDYEGGADYDEHDTESDPDEDTGSFFGISLG